jgi:hypothetical protein
MKKLLNPASMFAVGAALGVVSKLLDIWTVNNIYIEQFGYMFSELPIWVLLGIIISIFSETPKKAMLNIFPFCIGMLITYYATAELTGSVYGLTFIKGWLVFSCLSPLFAYFSWMTKERGLFPKIISVGIVIVTIVANFFLVRGFSVSDFIIIPAIIYILFFKKVARKRA